MARLVYQGTMNCPNCKEKLEIRLEKEIITPSTPAESQLNLYVKKISGIPSLIEKGEAHVEIQQT